MRLASSAPSMERRGVVAPSDGLIPASVTMPHNNVRSDGLIPDVSQKLVESQDLPDEELRLLLNRARVSRWTRGIDRSRQVHQEPRSYGSLYCSDLLR